MSTHTCGSLGSASFWLLFVVDHVFQLLDQFGHFTPGPTTEDKRNHMTPATAVRRYVHTCMLMHKQTHLHARMQWTLELCDVHTIISMKCLVLCRRID